MKTNFITIILFLATFCTFSNAQEPRGNRPGMNPQMMKANITITGKVFSKNNQKPVEYANIILFRKQDSTQVNGNISDKNGIFKITKVRPGRYFLDIQFMGFAKKRIERLGVRPGSDIVDVGEIYLTPEMVNMDEVLVEADRISVAFQIDKKVVNVGSQAVAASGTAVDVLENIPSVTVDIEGNVSLRGSENFTVLIDGRPTILEPNEILQQLPASKIENIEIITNPSAKFDPDGVAGILNVIMKKNKLEGISGIINLNGGTNKKYGTDVLVSYRNHKYSAFLSLDYNQRNFSGQRRSERILTNLSGDTYQTNSEGDGNFSMVPYSIRSGFEYFISPMDMLGLGVTFGNRSMKRSSDLMYEEFNSIDNIKKEYLSIDETKRGGNYFSFNLDYQHKFNNDGHELLGKASFNTRSGDDESINYLKELSGEISEGQKSKESGPSTDYRFKIDYTWPLNKTDKFEAGIQSRLDNSNEDNDVFNFNTETGEYEIQELFCHSTEYQKNIHSAYSMYSFARGRLGIQGGLRGEYTNRLVELIDEDKSHKINRVDLFPSAHISWKQTERTQFMGSYTRRIHRPRGYWLEPYITWRDAYTVRQGNPAIKPEYIDSYELSFLQYIGKNMFSLEAYRRINNNKVERVQSVYEGYDDVILQSIANVGKDYTFGTEFMLRMNLTKWWSVNLMGNLYDYQIKGEFNGQEFDNGSFNWNTRANSDFKLKTGTTLQINSGYNSRSVTAQGERKASYRVNMAIKQSFMKKKMTATLQVRDIFGTGKREYVTDTDRLYSYNYMEREAPVIMLNLRYNFNNYRETKKRSQENSSEFEMESEF